MKEINAKVLKKLVSIAQENIVTLENRSDLEAHRSDEEDFFDVSIWELKSVLISAYLLGKRNATKSAGAPAPKPTTRTKLTAKPLMTDGDQEMRDLFYQIVLRAESLGIRKGTRNTAILDIEKAAEHYTLRLRDLLAADDLSFTYDFAGIQSHINRIAGTFDDTFLPRFAGKKESA